MTPLRRALSILIGGAFLAAGGWVIYEELAVSGITSGRVAAASAFLVLVGGYMFWAAVSDPPKGKAAERKSVSDNRESDT